MIFIPFEKLRKKDKTLLDLREKFWIKEKKTALYGLNRVIKNLLIATKIFFFNVLSNYN